MGQASTGAIRSAPASAAGWSPSRATARRDGYALAVGGTSRWVVPGSARFSVSGDAYLAPEVLSGDDAEEYIDLSVRGGYAITRQADVYVGARYVRAEYERRPDSYFDTGMHLGLNIRF